MKKKAVIILLSGLIILIFSCTPSFQYSLEIPKLSQEEQLICHANYCFVFDDTHKQSKWIAYKLNSEMIIGNESRNTRFYPDSLVINGTATDADYRGSGFDRGHLVPAADMVFCSQAMKQSFYYSNVSPQNPSFNRGIWKKLETSVRKYAENNHELFIVTGPVLKQDLKTIGDNKVSIPEEFYKVVLIYNDTIQQGIAFLMPNEKASENSIFSYSLSIRQLETILDVNFFPNLKKKTANRIEMSVDTVFWQVLGN